MSGLNTITSSSSSPTSLISGASEKSTRNRVTVCVPLSSSNIFLSCSVTVRIPVSCFSSRQAALCALSLWLSLPPGSFQYCGGLFGIAHQGDAVGRYHQYRDRFVHKTPLHALQYPRTSVKKQAISQFLQYLSAAQKCCLNQVPPPDAVDGGFKGKAPRMI